MERVMGEVKGCSAGLLTSGIHAGPCIGCTINEASLCQRVSGCGMGTPSAHLPSASLGALGTSRTGRQGSAVLPDLTSPAHAPAASISATGLEGTRMELGGARRQPCTTAGSSPSTPQQPGRLSSQRLCDGEGDPATITGLQGQVSVLALWPLSLSHWNGRPGQWGVSEDPEGGAGGRGLARRRAQLIRDPTHQAPAPCLALPSGAHSLTREAAANFDFSFIRSFICSQA